ncbi:MAG: flagellar export chaperone FliS [bacterium]|nr:flagellar export chaperone FliS [bacterium]MDW8163157.1 flagellar export chaperone FliS [Candidatus Omnitrophota bacterium]
MDTYILTKIQTAPSYELVYLLYDYLLNLFEETKKFFEEKNPSKYEKITTSLLQSQAVVTELINSIDFEKGGEIAQNLYRLYEYVNWSLIQANIKKDKKFIEDAEIVIKDLKDIWGKAIEEFKKNEKNSDNKNKERR